MIARLLIRLMDAQGAWADPLGRFVQRIAAAIFRPIRPFKDFLNGTWLGHPVHAALTDLPIGILTAGLVLDVIGQPVAGDVCLFVGILAMLAAAGAGYADYVDTEGLNLRRATVHSTLMLVGLVVLVLSLLIRYGQPVDRALPIALAIIGYLILLAGAFVGGEVVYALGNMVSRHAWLSGGAKWQPLDVADIPEGVPTKAKAGTQPLVLVRNGNTILALHDTCAHAGGPLSGGKLENGVIECPWHFSRYRMADGQRVQGPTTYDQPRYEVRAAETGGWEARRAT